MQDIQLNKNTVHITQSFEWGEFRKKTGVKVLKDKDFYLFIHKIPHLPLTVGYLPRPQELNQIIIRKLIDYAIKNNCIFIKVEPGLTFNRKPAIPPACRQTGQAWHLTFNRKIKSSKSILPRHTFFIDLTKTEEELLGAMEPKTRYNIKVAIKHQVTIKEGGELQLEEFIKILEDTEKRQGFTSHPSNYYRVLWQTLKPAGMVYLLLAYPPNSAIKQFNNELPSNKLDGIPTESSLSYLLHPWSKLHGFRRSDNKTVSPIASIMLLKYKDRLYYPYGGSLPESRNLMPNHLLHFQAIKLGKKLGCKTYDMWGSYLEAPQPSDPWWGIYRFKSGFSGKVITYPESFDLIINPFLYTLFCLADFIRFLPRNFHRLLKRTGLLI